MKRPLDSNDKVVIGLYILALILFFIILIVHTASSDTVEVLSKYQQMEHLLSVRAGNEEAFKNRWITREQYDEYQKSINQQLAELEER